MLSDLGFDEIIQLMGEYNNLPPVSRIPDLSSEVYYQKVDVLRKYCKPDFLNDPAVLDFPTFGEWCSYITRFKTCSIAPHPNEFSSLLSSAVSKFANDSSSTTAFTNYSETATAASIIPKTQGRFFNFTCYDDFFCEHPNTEQLLFLIYGVIFTLICASGLLLHLACLVGFNKSTNQCGATLYFSVISLLDCIYLGIKMALQTCFLSDMKYSGQQQAYAERVAYFIPSAVPFLTFCEFTPVWLILCVLVDRHLYLQRGYFSKSVTSLKRHVRITCTVLCLSFGYVIPKFFEYRAEKNLDMPRGYRVVYTRVGNSTLYRNLMDYLLNIPLEMFLPYLAVAIVTCMTVSKMADFGSSKWKVVANFCSSSPYCCCDDFADCYPTKKRPSKAVITSSPITLNPRVSNASKILSPQSIDFVDGLPNSFTALPHAGGLDEGGHNDRKGQVFYCGIPFEKRSDLMPFYFLVPPPRQTLKETANVVISVCLGFLLLVTKIPKLILVALELEKYVEMDGMYMRMTKEALNLFFIILKPLIYLVLGVHFRHALTGLCCCACLYAPVIGWGSSLHEESHHSDVVEEIQNVVQGDIEKK